MLISKRIRKSKEREKEKEKEKKMFLHDCKCVFYEMWELYDIELYDITL